MARVFNPRALIAARARARLTMEKLAEAAGTSYQEIHRYEKDKTVPRDTTIVRLADALGVEIESLYSDGEN